MRNAEKTILMISNSSQITAFRILAESMEKLADKDWISLGNRDKLLRMASELRTMIK